MHLIEQLDARRLFAAGAIDTTYGDGDGSVAVATSRHAYRPRATASDATDDGRLVVASLYASRKQVGITRIAADGTVDRTFGKDGIVTLPIEPTAPLSRAGSKTPFDVALDDAGRVLVLVDDRLYRVRAGGGQDRKFGVRGSVRVPFGQSVVDVQPDAQGRALLVGTVDGKTGTRAAIARLEPRGALDRTFGGNGFYKTPVPKAATATRPGDASGAGLRVLADGRILGVADVAFEATDDPDDGVRVGVSAFRLDADGRPDPAYGGATTWTARSDAYTEVGVGLGAIAADGAVLVRAYAADTEFLSPLLDRTDFTTIDADGGIALERADPAPDSAPPMADTSGVEAIGLQADGKLLLASAGVYRLNADATIDAGFAFIPPPPSSAGASYVFGDRLIRVSGGTASAFEL